MMELARELWPLNRSLTGEGTMETLSILGKNLPDLKIKFAFSGKKVFDWEIPKVWTVSEAYILTPNGEKICDFARNNLHLVGYSIPVDITLSLTELKKHLHSLDSLPDAIPYVTSYYESNWGFCISKNELTKLKDGNYQVVINSKLESGQMHYGELLIPGQSKSEILISTYICHPSMANNEISGMVVATFLAKWIKMLDNRRYSYRFIFIPETIGSINYLSDNYKHLKKRVRAGFNITCVGDDRAYSFLPTRNGSHYIDLLARHILQHSTDNYIEYSWKSRGSDERQFCSPGIDLPFVSIMRSKYGEYSEYHTSLDKLDTVVTDEGLEGGFLVNSRAIYALEMNLTYENTILCEPHMSKRNLYPSMSKLGVHSEALRLQMSLLSMCDGKNSLLDIARKLDVPIWNLYEIIKTLLDHELIKPTHELKRRVKKMLSNLQTVLKGDF